MTINKLTMKKLTELWRRFDQWRRLHLFLTAKEAGAVALSQFTIGQEVAKHQLAEHQSAFIEAQKRTMILYSDLNDIRMEVNGRRQFIEIKILLDRKALAVLDVEDAARVLGSRTEQIYLTKLKKLVAPQINQQPKEQNAS